MGGGGGGGRGGEEIGGEELVAHLISFPYSLKLWYHMVLCVLDYGTTSIAHENSKVYN